VNLLSRVVLISLVAVLPALGMQAYNAQLLRRDREANVRASVLRDAAALNAVMDGLTRSVRDALASVAQYPEIQAADASACGRALHSAQDRLSFHSVLAFVNAAGMRLCSSLQPDLPPADVADAKAVGLAMERGDFIVAGFETGKVTGHPQLAMGYPVRGQDGRIIGELIACIDLNWLTDRVVAQGLPPNATVTVADRDGIYLIRLPERSWVGRKLPEADRWVLDAVRAEVREGVDHDGVRRIIGYVPISVAPRDLFVAVGASTGDAYAASDAAARRAYALMATGLIVAMALAVLMAHGTITRPVTAILQAAERARAGDYAVRVGISDSRSEFGRIGRAFNELLETVGRNEAGLRHSLAEIRAIYDSAPFGLGFVDRNFRHRNVNPPLAEINGLSVEEHVGRTVREVLPQLADAIEPQLRRAMDGESIMSVEVRGQTPRAPGVERTWLTSYHPVRATDGTVLGATVAVLETTVLRRTEAALQDSEARLALTQEAVGLGTYEWDLASDQLRLSPRAFALHGITPEPGVSTLSLQRWLDAIVPEDRGLAQGGVRAASEGRTLYSNEYRVRLSDGTIRWIAARGQVVADVGGRLGRMLGVIYDTTDRHEAEEALARANAELERRVEERTRELEAEVRERQLAQAQLWQAQKMEAVGQLTGGVAHDFNNLLTALIGNLELASVYANDNPALERWLAAAMRAADRGAALTQRMLAFSRRQFLRSVRIDLPALLGGMTELLDRTLGPTVAVATELPEDLWMILADPNQVELVILNLAINARDAMPEGGLVTISAANETVVEGTQHQARLGSGDYVRLAVSDTGAGMDAATLERAFEPFFTTKPVGKGSGLGLSMVHGFAAQSGGDVRIVSRPGEGTTVFVWLPRAHAPATAEPDIPPPPSAAIERGATILLVDDDPDVAAFAQLCLEGGSYRVFRAESGPAGLELLGRIGPVDLLVADLAMPGMDGAQLAAEARRRHPGLRVLLATGYADASALESAAAAFPVLHKPFKSAQLLASVAAILQERRSAAGVG
jgi:PAS domain S-box-containing protein